jgi:hypothetical protein
MAAVLTVLLGGGAFAFYQIDPLHVFRAGPQAAQAIPANALMYAGFDVSPTAEQQVSALRFLNSFPAFRARSGLDGANTDVRSVVFGKTVAAMRCPGLAYDSDVKPWIGSKFGVAALPSAAAGSSPSVVAALEVTDQSKASAGLRQIRSCVQSKGGPSFGYSFVGDFALLAQTQAQAGRDARAAAASSLADRGTFQADMSSLGDLGVATVWVDVAGALNRFETQVPAAGQLGDLRSASQRAAATLRFSGDAAEIVTSVYGRTPAVSHGDNQIVRLPASTVFALSEAGGGQRVNASWDAIRRGLAAGGTSVDSALAKFESRTGLRLPQDLRTLFGNNLLFALDGRGLATGNLQAGDLGSINAGFRFTNDPAALNALYGKVRRLIGRQTSSSLPVAKVDASDGIAVATNQGYANVLAGLSGNLGDSSVFQSVTSDAAGGEFVGYFNWDAVESRILPALRSSGAPQQVIDNLRPVKAIGVTSGVQGHYTVGTIQVSVDD